MKIFTSHEIMLEEVLYIDLQAEGDEQELYESDQKEVRFLVRFWEDEPGIPLDFNLESGLVQIHLVPLPEPCLLRCGISGVVKGLVTCYEKRPGSLRDFLMCLKENGVETGTEVLQCLARCRFERDLTPDT